MHNRRQLTTDACLGTTLFADALIGAWYLPFSFPVTLTGGHHALGVSFDLYMIFGNKIPGAAQGHMRGVYSNDMPKVQKFNDISC